MHLTTLDWIIVVSLGISFLPAIVLARRAGRNITEFFAAGRQAPWWLIGISLVASNAVPPQRTGYGENVSCVPCSSLTKRSSVTATMRRRFRSH